MKNVYLDNAATTAVRSEVIEEMIPYLGDKFGNPSSLHSPGRLAKEALEDCRGRIAKIINANPAEIIFTSGGTESNNFAIKGIATLKEKGHIITSKIEHSSILNPLKYLEKKGFTVTYVGVNQFGQVDIPKLQESITPQTILITIGHANNEIGTIQNIERIGDIAKKHEIPLHTDACQSFTKTAMDVKKMGLGLATINAHKINGPKGVGALYVSRGTKLSAFIHGGQQERGLRGGTENVAGVVGFAKAAELVTASELKKMQLLRDKLISGITAGIKDSRLNGHPKERLVNNTNFTFKNVEGEALLLRLDMKGVYCSTGSACSSQSLEPSHIITAIGLPPEESHGSLRATLGYNSSDEDIDYAIETISDEVENLRKISPLTRR